MIQEHDLYNLCIDTARKLIVVPSEKYQIGEFDPKSNLQSRLIFPSYGGEKIDIRISEQESRFLFAQSVEESHKQIYYSIETPTDEKYRFTPEIQLDPQGQSAMYDMTLYELNEANLKNPFIPKVNIEFKAHNVEKTHIEKDILKLIAEKPCGLFFHFLQAVDSGTLPSSIREKTPEPDQEQRTGILDKYRISVEDWKKKWKSPEDETEKFILFAICIRKQGILLLKSMRPHDLKDTAGFFKISYQVREGTMEIIDRNNWDTINIIDKTPYAN